MTIIEVDGVLHEPLIVDSIQIFAGAVFVFVRDDAVESDAVGIVKGQRYSFVVSILLYQFNRDLGDPQETLA